MTKTFAVLALAGLAGTGVANAGSSSAQMSVGVTVARSCAVDARPAGKASPLLRLTCTNGANSNLRVSETAQPSSAPVVSDGSKTLTLNF
jgi:hypothetical protein